MQDLGAFTKAFCVIGAACAVSACMTSEANGTISDFSAELHENSVSATRYNIVIYSGAGIPGSPGANQFFRKPREVLQAVVDSCKLGSTVYQKATDGVSVLHVLDADLAQSKVDCVKSAEEPGLSLIDRGVGQ